MPSLTRRRNRRVTRVAMGKPQGRSTLDMLLWNHLKLWASVLFGLGVGLLFPGHWPVIPRVLLGWNAGIIILVLLTWLLLRRLDAQQLRAHYEEEDPTGPVILLASVIAALLSIIAIVALVSSLKEVGPTVRVVYTVLATLTIVDSWLLIHTLFALHYADMVYSVGPDSAPLTFPGTRTPLFWDFIYFSFTIGVACQTADVATTGTGIRRTVILHSLIAFLFNLAILGFAINVSAGLLGSH